MPTTTFDDTGTLTPSGALPAAAAANALDLKIPSRGIADIKFRVPLATGAKQVNVYFNR
jgi:hypothetical protein